MRPLVSLIAAVLAILPARFDAQTAQPRPAAKKVCFRGRPLPACERFWLTELEVTAPIVRSRWNRDEPRNVLLPHAINGWFTGDVGMMRNLDATNAAGGMLHVGLDWNGNPRLALKARRRWWHGNDSYDLDAGVLQLNSTSIRPLAANSLYGVTMGGALNAGDYTAATVHVEAVYADGRPRVALLIGARVGSQPAVITGAALAAGFLALFALYSRAGGLD